MHTYRISKHIGDKIFYEVGISLDNVFSSIAEFEDKEEARNEVNFLNGGTIFKDDDEDWLEVGVVGVDGGQIFIGDPCYLEDEKQRLKIRKFSMETAKNNWECANVPYEGGHLGLGFISETGIGDGIFKVYKHHYKNELKIVFE